jgi:cell wall-associated NlpC family hydrolase
MTYLFSPTDIITYASRFVGTPYTWGGSSADEGFDCSGFIYEVLSAYGVEKPAIRPTAQSLYEFYSRRKPLMSEVRAASLLFFGESLDKITHVAIANNDWQMIEAGGEGSNANRKGTVRYRPISNRKDFLIAVSIL